MFYFWSMGNGEAAGRSARGLFRDSSTRFGASPPTSAATFPADFPYRSSATSLAPSLAMTRQHSAPMPDPPPVTMTTLPFIHITGSLLDPDLRVLFRLR
jgi:hypothetical protein